MNELSKERLENYASGSWYPDADYVKAMARELLALRKARERAEPVAWMKRSIREAENWDSVDPEFVKSPEGWMSDYLPLYTAPPAPVVADDELMAGNHIAWMNKNFPRKTFSDEEWEELSLYTWLAWRDSCRDAMLAAAPGKEG
ncbi:hypothetical protein [Cronobacter sakazakii]|uniref:hypothetical protein n=1 Tax=Cronobacter sakazakii TaxID=28141 RepID=UPI000975B776|nr:hypothetical protein [Cronobacter sakazakii]